VIWNKVGALMVAGSSIEDPKSSVKGYASRLIVIWHQTWLDLTIAVFYSDNANRLRGAGTVGRPAGAESGDMKLLIGKKLIAAFGLAVLLLTIGAVSRASTARLLATAGWVMHSHQTMAKLETMAYWVERTETMQRDFLMIDEDSYLASYDVAFQAIDQTSSELRTLTIGSPSQQHRLNRLLELIHTRRDEIYQLTELRRRQGLRVSLPEVVAGTTTANAIQDLIGEMEGEEHGLLKQRVDEASASARRADQLITIGNLLTLGLVALSGWAIYRDIVRRARAEMALRESEARYRSLIATLSEGIVLQDADGLIRTSNASAERILGLSADQMAGRSSLDSRWRTIHEDRTPFPVDQYPATVTLRTGQSCENVIMGVYKPNGTLNWISINSQPMFQEGAGQPYAVVCTFADISERLQAEEALRAAEERFRTLVEQLPAITYIAALDAASSTLYTSPQIETMLGFSQAEWMADHDLWRRQIHPDDYDRVMADIEHSQASGIPVPSEYRMLTRDGRAKWFRDQAVIVQNADGQSLFMQGIMFDITERKQAEVALRTSESRNRALLDAIPDLIFRLSCDGIYLDVRAERDSDLILPSDALLGRTVFDVLPPDVARQTMACIEQALRTDAVQVIEYQLMLEQTARDFEARVVVCAENEVMAIVREITERKNIERMKNEFVSTVSHELRTPLTSIRGSLGLIVGGVAGEIPPQAQSMVEIAYKNSERLIRLINDILDIEKIESGKMIFNFQPVELMPLLEHAIDINRAYGQQFDVTFALESAIAGAWVQADSDRLVQAVTNLLSNAAKFSPPGSRALVSLVRRGGMLRIAIRDCGPGIPEAFRARLFQKFAQADASDARQKGGTGLGLSITKAIVEKLGGQIDVTTEPGAGSMFFIDLPEWRAGAALSGARVPIKRPEALNYGGDP
jgi:PAS domain S-box-containing protein